MVNKLYIFWSVHFFRWTIDFTIRKYVSITFWKIRVWHLLGRMRDKIGKMKIDVLLKSKGFSLWTRRRESEIKSLSKLFRKGAMSLCFGESKVRSFRLEKLNTISLATFLMRKMKVMKGISRKWIDYISKGRKVI